MTELMLRLFKDGKIVGYEWHRFSPEVGFVLIHHYPDLTGGLPMFMPRHDAFEMGVKVGDTWIFEGDYVAHIEWGTRGMIHRDCSGLWEIWAYADDESIVPSKVVPFIERAENWKLIGNIHEEAVHE